MLATGKLPNPQAPKPNTVACSLKMKVSTPCESSVGLGQYTADVHKSLILNPVVADVQHSKGSVVLEQH